VIFDGGPDVAQPWLPRLGWLGTGSSRPRLFVPWAGEEVPEHRGPF